MFVFGSKTELDSYRVNTFFILAAVLGRGPFIFKTAVKSYKGDVFNVL